MGALSKFFLSPIYKLISLYFSKFLPETLKFIILSLIMLYSSYRRETSRIVYTASINKNSSKFVYKRKCPAQETAPFDSPDCSICLSEYQDGDVARRLRCNHTFHKKCSDKWFQGSLQATCPICRTWLVPEGIMEERRRLEEEHQSVKGNVEEKIALILLPTVNLWTYNSGFFSDYTYEIY